MRGGVKPWDGTLGQDWQDLAVGGSGAVVSYQRKDRWVLVSFSIRSGHSRCLTPSKRQEVGIGSQPGSWAAALIPSIPSGLWQALTTSPVQVLIWKGEVRTGTCKPLQPRHLAELLGGANRFQFIS